MERGVFIVVTGPAAAGKTTIVEKYLKAECRAKRLVTTTTRAPREGERNGIDYHFVGEDEFLARRFRKEFLEWARVHERYYGSSRLEAEKLLAQWPVVIAVMDIQGAKVVKRLVEGSLAVMLVAPVAHIRRRLEARFGPGHPEIALRLEEVETELSQAQLCDHVIENPDGAEADSLAAFAHIVEPFFN